MKVTIKRKDVNFLIEGLKRVNGMKDFRKAISLGRDSRILKAVQDETEEAFKNCKPEKFDALSEEIRDMKAAKAKEYEVKEGEVLNENFITTHVLLKWDKAKEWHTINKEYNEAIEAVGNEKVEVEFHTELTESDFPKCAEDIQIAEVLSYFLKE